ncbi:hypothetical protein ACQKWADRAFT_282026 [Trichoderma austrokoningii]
METATLQPKHIANLTAPCMSCSGTQHCLSADRLAHMTFSPPQGSAEALSLIIATTAFSSRWLYFACVSVLCSDRFQSRLTVYERFGHESFKTMTGTNSKTLCYCTR